MFHVNRPRVVELPEGKPVGPSAPTCSPAETRSRSYAQNVRQARSWAQLGGDGRAKPTHGRSIGQRRSPPPESGSASRRSRKQAAPSRLPPTRRSMSVVLVARTSNVPSAVADPMCSDCGLGAADVPGEAPVSGAVSRGATRARRGRCDSDPRSVTPADVRPRTEHTSHQCSASSTPYGLPRATCIREPGGRP